MRPRSKASTSSKNIVLVSAGLVIGATVRDGRVVSADHVPTTLLPDFTIRKEECFLPLPARLLYGVCFNEAVVL
jgi:hypothetical protein